MSTLNKCCLLVLIICQVSCADYCADSVKRDAAEWFSKNQAEMEAMVDLLLTHKNIERVESPYTEFTPRYGDFTDADYDAYESLFREKERLGIKHVVAHRIIASSELLSIDFTLIATGMVFAPGYVLSVEYIPDHEIIEKSKPHGFFHYPLGPKNWYIEENDWCMTKSKP